VLRTVLEKIGVALGITVAVVWGIGYLVLQVLFFVLCLGVGVSLIARLFGCSWTE